MSWYFVFALVHNSINFIFSFKLWYFVFFRIQYLFNQSFMTKSIKRRRKHFKLDYFDYSVLIPKIVQDIEVCNDFLILDV